MRRTTTVLVLALFVLSVLAPVGQARKPPVGYTRDWAKQQARKRCKAKGGCSKIEVKPCLVYRGVPECVVLIEFEGGYCTWRVKTQTVKGLVRNYSTQPICA